jgi:hypothetical protein
MGVAAGPGARLSGCGLDWAAKKLAFQSPGWSSITRSYIRAPSGVVIWKRGGALASRASSTVLFVVFGSGMEGSCGQLVCAPAVPVSALNSARAFIANLNFEFKFAPFGLRESDARTTLYQKLSSGRHSRGRQSGGSAQYRIKVIPKQ